MSEPPGRRPRFLTNWEDSSHQWRSHARPDETAQIERLEQEMFHHAEEVNAREADLRGIRELVLIRMRGGQTFN